MSIITEKGSSDINAKNAVTYGLNTVTCGLIEMSEEKRIIELLGRTEIDGDVRGSHLGKVLTYLKITKNENWDVTLAKLALVLGVNPRYVRENYLKGLMYFGVIKLYRNGNALYWEWVGEKAFSGSAIPSEPEQKMKELNDTEKEKTKEENKCPNCGKKLEKDKKFCNEKCVSEYYLNKNKLKMELEKDGENI